MKSKMLSLVLVLAVIVLSGCSKKDDTTTNTTSLIGTYTRPYNGALATFKVKDATNFGFGFTSGGVYSETVAGTYTNTTTQISITQVSGSGAGCPGVVGTYNYVLTGSNMAFTVVSDACDEGGGVKRSSFVSNDFTKQ